MALTIASKVTFSAPTSISSKKSEFQGAAINNISMRSSPNMVDRLPITKAAKDTGVFAPIVKTTKDIVGVKKFNQFRGKAIALHSQVITEFCKSVGADTKYKQGLIRLAKKNGEWLGFLA